MKAFAFATIFLGLANAQPAEVKVESVEYTDPYDNNFPLLGYVSIPETTPAPAVLIVVRKRRRGVDFCFGCLFFMHKTSYLTIQIGKCSFTFFDNDKSPTGTMWTSTSNFELQS